MTPDVRVERGKAGLARPLTDQICALYDEVFSQPPFHWRVDESRLHRARLASLLDDPSFGIVLAWVGDTDAVSSELAGFAYGFALAPGTTRWSRLVEPLPAATTAEWPGRTFFLFDYAVRERHRGRGIGRRLHDTLLGSRAEQRATLSTQPSATATKAMYERWGWRMVGQSVGGPTASAPLFDVYLRDRLDDLRSAGSAVADQ